MKVKDLVEQLTYCREDDEVVIPVMGYTLGAEPCVRIERITSGFDWNSNKVFLRATRKLVCADEINPDLSLKDTTNSNPSVPIPESEKE